MDATATDATDRQRNDHRQAEQAIRRLHEEWFDASAVEDRLVPDRPGDGLAATELEP